MDTGKSNWVLLGLLLLVWLAVAGVSWSPARRERTPAPPPPQAGSQAEVVIDFGDGTKRTFSGPVEPGTKVIEAMSFAAAVGQLPLEFAGRDRMAVVRIGNYTNTVEHRWQVTIAGRGPVQDIEQAEIRPGDQLRVLYQ